MEHPFKLVNQNFETKQSLSDEQLEQIGGGRPGLVYTTMAHGEEGGMPEAPDM
ncbi:MAG: hypothetical protein ACFHVJ_07705 [Aestuariibacter sp.]